MPTARPNWFSHEDRNEATERYQQQLKINTLNHDKDDACQ